MSCTWASQNGHADIIRALKENGALTNIKDEKGHKPNYYARIEKKKDAERQRMKRKVSDS